MTHRLTHKGTSVAKNNSTIQELTSLISEFCHLSVFPVIMAVSPIKTSWQHSHRVAILLVTDTNWREQEQTKVFFYKSTNISRLFVYGCSILSSKRANLVQNRNKHLHRVLHQVLHRENNARAGCCSFSSLTSAKLMMAAMTIVRCNKYAECDSVEGSDTAKDELNCNEEYRNRMLIPKQATIRCT